MLRHFDVSLLFIPHPKHLGVFLHEKSKAISVLTHSLMQARLGSEPSLEETSEIDDAV